MPERHWVTYSTGNSYVCQCAIGRDHAGSEDLTLEDIRCPFDGCQNFVGRHTVKGRVGDVIVHTRICDDHHRWLSQGTLDHLSLSATIRRGNEEWRA